MGGQALRRQARGDDAAGEWSGTGDEGLEAEQRGDDGEDEQDGHQHSGGRDDHRAPLLEHHPQRDERAHVEQEGRDEDRVDLDEHRIVDDGLGYDPDLREHEDAEHGHQQTGYAGLRPDRDEFAECDECENDGGSADGFHEGALRVGEVAVLTR
jgi:hypothetical protein